jgi:DnaK suppressor protein
MTTIELQTFRRLLENRQADLGRENGNRAAIVIEASPDELDRIQHGSECDYAMGNRERDGLRSREVQEALGRIDAGTFGVCAGCGGNIDARRLAAVPWASSCIVCQRAADYAPRTFPAEIRGSLGLAA